VPERRFERFSTLGESTSPFCSRSRPAIFTLASPPTQSAPPGEFKNSCVVCFHDFSQFSLRVGSTDAFSSSIETPCDLKQRQGRAALNIPEPSEGAKPTYTQLREALLSHRRNHNARSLAKCADGTETIWGLDHLDAFFQDKAANEITTRALQGFVEYRKRAGANVATINRNRGLLRQMSHLAAPDNPLLKIPNFSAVHFKEDHIRQGFLDALSLRSCSLHCLSGCVPWCCCFILPAFVPARHAKFSGNG
jgi:hypothetical protein